MQRYLVQGTFAFGNSGFFAETDSELLNTIKVLLRLSPVAEVKVMLQDVPELKDK